MNYSVPWQIATAVRQSYKEPLPPRRCVPLAVNEVRSQKSLADACSVVFRLGSLADIPQRFPNVRFTLESEC